MTREQVIQAIRAQCRFIRRVTGRTVAQHFSINSQTIYIDYIKIEFGECCMRIYDKNKEHLLSLIFYSFIDHIG